MGAGGSNSILSLVGFYRKKLAIFVFAFVLLLITGVTISSKRYQADTSPLISDTGLSTLALNVEVLPNGKILVDGKETKKRVSLLPDSDEVRIPVVDNLGIYYDKITITLTLPEDISDRTEHEILAVHGVGSATSYVKDSRSIVYEAEAVSGTGIVSLVAGMPRGTVSPGFSAELTTRLSDVHVDIWLWSAIFLPILTTVLMAFFLVYHSRSQRVDMPEKEVSAPPMALPPAIVGVLVQQRVRSREIAATLVDLAIRGDIAIIDRERGFSFGKGKFDQRLLGYEKLLLSKIFQNNFSASRLELERRINDHFYSQKISLVSSGIYALTTRLGYFKTNPQGVHRKYKLIGISSFLLGLLGFVLSLVYFTNPPYVVFFWIGMMLSALVIAVKAAGIPLRTSLGRETLSNWLAFKRFLSSSEPINYSVDVEELFHRYLAYAIVLDCEAAWAKRFSHHNFTLPNWFVTDKTGLGLEDFCLALFPIISYVGKSLAALREPGFE